MRVARLCCVLAASLACLGCDSGDDEDEGDDGIDTPLDPNAAPVVQGTWYRPTVATTWQWQIKGTINTSYAADVYDVDLFDCPSAVLTELKAAGKHVICYFSAGSSENWRSDFAEFQANDMGGPLDDWEGERWLDIRQANVHRIMRARLDLAKSRGCEGVEPDNVDGFANETGFDLTESDQLAFNRFIANEAHIRGLAVGLKNDGDQAAALVDYYDFELNEQCHEFSECDGLAVFTAKGKPIFNAEYPTQDTLAAAQALSATICPAAKSENIRTLILPLELDDAFRVSCEP